MGPRILWNVLIVLPSDLEPRLAVHLASILVSRELRVPVLLMLETNLLILLCLIVCYAISSSIIILTIVVSRLLVVLSRIHHVSLCIICGIREAAEPARAALLGYRRLHLGGWDVVIVLLLVKCTTSHMYPKI